MNLDSTSGALLHTNCPTLTLASKGKVRDIYHIDAHSLLFVATDRISAFDVIMKNGIPGKGQMLTAISLFWFHYLQEILPNHVITSTLSDMPLSIQTYQDQLEGRCILVKKLNMIPIEAVVRGYLSGSVWQAYKKEGSYCGIKLPKGMKEFQKLDTPIFTPTTKAEIGDHDMPISFDKMKEMLGESLATQIKQKSLELFTKASEYALSRDLILADTKFEFGLDSNQNLYLADEVLTPDSSRFWFQPSFNESSIPYSFDKQYLRNYLLDIQFDQQHGIELPPHIIKETQVRYAKCLALITGRP